jgi:hypothetical protein
MKKYLFIVLTAIPLLLMLSCQYFTLMPYKDWLDKNNANEVDVYIAGENSSKACYWKNNELNQLSANTSTVNSIFIYDNKVYTGGNDNSKACYWVNNEIFILDNTSSNVYSIFVKSGIVYATGQYNTNIACYWKNNKLYDLGLSGNATSIYIDDNGNEYISLIASPSFYLINNKKIYLELASEIRSMFVLNGNVYCVGLYNGSFLGLWINDKKIYNSSFTCRGYSVFVDDNDIHMVGLNPGTHAPYYLKNLNQVDLPASMYETMSVYVFNKVVYVAGYYNAAPANQACYWKNGDTNIIGSAPSLAKCITVQMRVK